MTTETRPPRRFAVIGFGRIGRRILERLPGTPGAPALAGVLVRPAQWETAAALVGEARVFGDLDGLLAARPDVVVECAGATALAQWGQAVLGAGADLIPLSLAAFADPAVEAAMIAAAERGPGRLEIPAGAMGSIGFLAAAREDRLDAVTFRAAYPPARWQGTPAQDRAGLAAAGRPAVVFEGSVREAVRLFPRHINVAVGVALAGLGLDATRATLVSDMALAQAVFEVAAQAGPGPARLLVEGRDAPLGADPVDYTTFSVMRLLRRRQAAVMI